MSKREKTADDKLRPEELIHIIEFGHNPIMIFDKPHEVFDSKTYDNSTIMHNVIFQHVWYVINLENDCSDISYP